MVDFGSGVDQKEQGGGELRDRRCDGGTGNAESGKSPLAEDQCVVQYDVDRKHDERVCREDLRMGDAHVESAEHDGDERKEEAIDPPVRVVDSRFVHRSGGDHFP